MDHQQRVQAPSHTKIERRLIEKNRRNQMKILYSKLNSLLPNFNPKQMIPLPDQIDEAINYIKSLEAKVKMAQEKKEKLMGKKRSHACCSSSSFETKRSRNSPQIQIHEMGSSLEVVLINGLDNQFIFYEIICILHEENVEVVSANSSLAGDSMLNVVHAQIQPSLYEFGATKVTERLKRFVYGSASDVELQPAELQDYFQIDQSFGLLMSKNIAILFSCDIHLPRLRLFGHMRHNHYITPKSIGDQKTYPLAV
ncbi:transcription factor bHLH162-like [Neltuma alba]|uniref:transcription factor bHLH162-like n=1 Tax=Neltuma alba TaxID=207710 RepID=UPI0010A4CC6A|nr:transcription factor bHLH162-like [Prosopis alba]